MKKVLLMMIAMVSITMGTMAAPVDEATAREYACQFLNDKAGGDRLRAVIPSGDDMQLVLTEMSNVVIGRAVFYVFNTDNSFIVVSGDDCIQHILAFGETPIDMDNIPCGLQFLLNMYKRGIDSVYSGIGGGELMMSSPRPRLTAGQDPDVAPLLTAMWSQEEPYNRFCPPYNGELSVTGCSCTSLSMVLYYWKYANLTKRLSSYTTRSLGLTLDALEPTDFDWDNMLDVYEEGCYTDEQSNAVALLMRYVGQAEYMDYSPEGSGAYDANVVGAAKKFGYDQGLTLNSRSGCNDDQWHALIMTELLAGRPIVYFGYNYNDNIGHAFNLDGYDAQTGFYHFNFGWGGYCNAYCALVNIDAGGYTFNDNQAMITGIQPPDAVQPEIILAPAKLTLNTQAGKTVTKSFTVKGRSLEGDLTVALDDPRGVFSVSKTNVTAEQVADGGVTVNVSFSPATACVATATVTVSGGGAEAKTIALTGVATAAPTPTITVDCTTMGFEALVGETVTATFTVSGANLTGDLTLALDDASGCYSIDKTSIAMGEASAGVAVEVTYNPMTAGESAASVMISGGGAEARTVTLNGAAVQPEPPGEPSITTSESSLDFGNCYNGYNERRSLILTGVNLTENITLSLTGCNAIDFTIVSPTTITPEMAAQGTEVIVNSFPYSETTYWDMYLIISCPDVPMIKIPITGHSIKTGAFIRVSEDSLQFTTTARTPVTMTLGVTLREFDGWIASTGGSATNPGDWIGDWTIIPLEMLPVLASIEGNECFSIVSSGTVFSRTSDGRDSMVFTIKYYPLEAGTHSAQLTLNTLSLTHQAHPVVVELMGIAAPLLLGDLDGDGQLTVNDIMLLSQAMTDRDDDVLSLAAADVNGDGIVDLSDVIDLVDLVQAAENLDDR